MWGHPLTALIMVAIACAVVSSLFGLLKALRGPVGMLAYLGLMGTLYSYYQIGDKYFSESIWEISIGSLAVMALTLKRVPFLRTVLAVAIVEFGSRINKTDYPKQTVLVLGIAAAMIAIATFWTPRTPKAAAPPPAMPAAYRRGPQLFDPYTGRPLRKEQATGPSLSAFWRWARRRVRS